MSTFLNNIDTEKVDTLLKETDENVKYFESVSDSVVGAYTESLDAIMRNINKDIISVTNPDIDTIEKYFLELSSALYYMGEKLEHLGIYDDMSKSAAKEVYNKAYLNNQIKDPEKKNKTTVAENQAVAEAASIYETSVNNIYSRSYRVFKYKIDAAQGMLSSLSKILSKRISENQLTMSTNGRQRLNETF